MFPCDSPKQKAIVHRTPPALLVVNSGMLACHQRTRNRLRPPSRNSHVKGLARMPNMSARRLLAGIVLYPRREKSVEQPFKAATTAFEPACLPPVPVRIPRRQRTTCHGILSTSSAPLAAIRQEFIPDLASGRQSATHPIPPSRRPLQRSGVRLAGSLS